VVHVSTLSSASQKWRERFTVVFRAGKETKRTETKARRNKKKGKKILGAFGLFN